MFDTDKFSDSEHTLDAVQTNNNMHINYQVHWMPFSANRNFAKDPRMIVGAKGSYLIDDSGREIFDSLSGLWTCGAGHTLPEIQQAVSAQLGQLDY
ncbi:aminotransferase class-III family protein, partial [Acinetobacter baumannii 44362_6]